MIKNKYLFFASLLVLVLSMSGVSALNTPYSLSGYCNDVSGTPLIGVGITFTNLNSSEIIYATSTMGGEYQQDAANFASGYFNSDNIRYESAYNTLTGNVSALITVSNGGTLLNLTLSGDAGCSGAIALKNAININDTVGVHAAYSGCVVTITADAKGDVGNTITTTETCSNASFGAGNLTGGSDTQLSGGWGDEDIYSGVELWTKTAPLLALLIAITLLVLVISTLMGFAHKDGRFAEGLNVYQIISIASVLLALMAVFSIVPLLGFMIDNVAQTGSCATGELTFTGDAVEGETVTIGGIDIYEFDDNGSVVGGNILVPLP